MNEFLKRIESLSPEQRGALAQKLNVTRRAVAQRPSQRLGRSVADLPLSSAQRRLWFLNQLRPGDVTYNIPVAVRLKGPLDIEALTRARDEIIRRHEILRTVFPALDGKPHQIINPARSIKPPIEDLTGLPESQREDEARRRAEIEAAQPFDLAQGPLLRVKLLKIQPDDHAMLLTMHHIISDGWSMGVMIREVRELYDAFCNGRPSPLPEMKIQYSDYALWEQQPAQQRLFDRQLEYWKGQLVDLPTTIDLPTDRPRPPVQSFRGSVVEFKLDESVARSLLALRQREGATLFMTLLAGFAVLLHRYSGQSDLAIGADVANRNWSETEGLIGFFINQLVLRVDTSGEPTFLELLQRVKDLCLDAFANQDLPFDRLVSALQPERNLSYTPLFQVKLVVQNTAAEAVRLTNLTVEPFDIHHESVGFDLILTAFESPGGVSGSLEYNTDIFEESTIRRMLGHLATILESAVEAPGQRISHLAMISPAERRRLLQDFNRAEALTPEPSPCLHQIFERQAAEAPERTAVIAGEARISYGELNARANQLAHHLCGRGIGPEARVGLFIERSIDMVVGMLGVLKAGAAYVPMDPKYPQERLDHMIEDSRIPVLVTQERLLDFLPSVWAQVVCLDADAGAIALERADNPEIDVSPRNAAYVIYTSGSTGQPKGVVVEHHGIANLVRWQAREFNLSSRSRISQFASYSFDAAVGETCMALLNGATLIMIEREDMDARALIDAVNRHRINVLVMVPSMLRALDAAALERPEELTVVAVGEVCPPDLALRWSRRCRFVNAYGPTEYTVYSHLWNVAPETMNEASVVPIGFPISNTRTYILDAHLNPVPVGVTGDIYISGPGIARGYLNKPGVTAGKFLPNPFLICDYFIEQDRLEVETAAAEIRAFKGAGHPLHQAAKPDRREWPKRISPAMVFKLVDSLSPDLVQKTHAFIARHAEDSAVYDAFSRYLLEGVNDSYASCGINPDVLRRLLPFENFEGVQGIDFGFGNGEILKTLKEMGARIKGLDFNPVFVQKACDAALEAEMLKIDLAPSEFAAVSGIQAGSQDFAVSTLLLDRLANPGNALANLFAVLKEGGRFAIQTLLPIIGVDDGQYDDPINYTPENESIVPGKSVEGDKRALILFLRKLGADKIEVFKLPYVVLSRDGLQEYTVWSFTGNKNSSLPQSVAVEYFDAMYRTDDRGRFLPGGEIEFRGRGDAQVKIRGYRIELSEIEAALSSFAGVQNCAAVALDNPQGGKRLVAYLVASGDRRLPKAEMTDFLRRKLPEFMIPTAFVQMEQLPQLPNGKLDYHKLPAPTQDTSELPSFVEPRNSFERTLARAWRETLGLERVGVHDNIFELGGDSILILQILAKLNQEGIGLSANQFFKYQTIAKLAEAHLETAVKEAEQGPVVGVAPLTSIQQWFFEQELVNPSHYNQSILLQLKKTLDADLLREAFGSLVAHHDALRLRFRRTENGYEQSNLAAVPCEIFSRQELTVRDESEARAQTELAAAELQASLDLEEGVLIKARLFSFGGKAPDRLLIIVHHLAIDGVSWRILIEDLQSAYSQLRRQEAPLLPPKTASWKSWAERVQALAASPALDEDAGYWVAALPSEMVEPPIDFPGGENTEAQIDSVRLTLTPEETRELLESASKIGRASLNEVLIAGLGQAIATWTGARAAYLDLEGHGREDLFEDIDVSRTVGWFTSLYPIFLDFRQAQTPLESAAVVKDTLRSMPRRGVGFGLLRHGTAGTEAAHRLRSAPLAAVSFNYLGQLDHALKDSPLFEKALDLDAPDHSPAQRRRYLLEITAFVAGAQLHLNIMFSRGLHRRSTVEALAERTLDFLRKAPALGDAQQTAAAGASDFPLAERTLAKLDSRARAALLGSAGPLENVLPLTPLQQGMLFHSIAAPELGVYVNQMSCELKGEIDVGAFRKAWEQVIERHGVFRTSYAWGALDEPLALVRERAELSFAEEDWREMEATERRKRVSAYLEEDRVKGFDLTKAPLMRMGLLRLDETSACFFWSFHHLLLDGWSVYLALNEVFALYQSECEGRAADLAPALLYEAYLAWLGKQDMAKAEVFWRRTLSDLTAPANLASTNEPGPERFEEYNVRFSAELSRRLQNFARRRRLTMNTIVQGVWALLLGRYTNSNDVMFGAVVSGRPAALAGIERTVGLFINTLPVRVRISRTLNLLAWLESLQAQQVERAEYEYSPLMQIQAWSGLPAGTALFNSILAFENYPIDNSLAQHSARLQIHNVRSIEQTNYPLTALVLPGDELSIGIVYDAGRFDRQAIERMMGHFETLLGAVPESVHLPLSALPMLSPDERRTVLYDWNADATSLPPQEAIHRLFSRQAERTPTHVAVSCPKMSLTYCELEEISNRLARYLTGLGVGRGSLVGVCLPRSTRTAIVVLGVMKAGAAYVPLDPSYPEARLKLMVEDSGMEMMVAEGDVGWAEGVGKLRRVVDLDLEAAQIERQEARSPAVEATSDDAAYVIYTSGSTGRPKGVIGLHGGAVNRFHWMWNKFPFEEGEVCCQKTALSFLDSLWEFFGPLLQGVRLVILPDDVVKDPQRLVETLAEAAVSRIVLVPSLLRALLDAVPSIGEKLPRLKTWVSSGEELPSDLSQRFHAAFPKARLLNLYGSSEVSADVSFHETNVANEAGRKGLIGRPIANTDLYILNRDMEPAPIEAPGELYVGGMSLARGYLHSPAMTAERFVPDPYSGRAGARLFRTGDIARWSPDGALDYLGRVDHQVKIRGFRVELGEIESIMREHPTVREALATARNDERGGPRLVAYYVCENGLSLQSAALREFLKQRVQDYMLPSVFLQLPKMPLTPSGKVDKLALPAPDQSRPETGAAFIVPRTEIEKGISRIWQEVLNVDAVGVNDNFFELGGQSLLIIRVQVLLKERLNIALSVGELFKYPTIGLLAAQVAGVGAGEASFSLLQSLERGKRRKRRNRRER